MATAKKTRTKVLSLISNYCQKDYYLLKNSEGSWLYVLEEISGKGKSDYYTVYYTWDQIIMDLLKHESKELSKYRWWSYCPAWTNFKPGFIHEKFKSYFSQQIHKAMDGVQSVDLTQQERTKLSIWMKACKSENGSKQSTLFN